MAGEELRFHHLIAFGACALLPVDFFRSAQHDATLEGYAVIGRVQAETAGFELPVQVEDYAEREVVYEVVQKLLSRSAEGFFIGNDGMVFLVVVDDGFDFLWVGREAWNMFEELKLFIIVEKM